MDPRGRHAASSAGDPRVHSAAAIAGLVTWLIARDALRLGTGAATLGVALVVGMLLAWRRLALRARPLATLDAQGLRLARADEPGRRIPWRSIRTVRRRETSVRERTLRFASLELDSGESIALADLGASRAAVVELPDGRAIAHVTSPDELLASVAANAPDACIERGASLDDATALDLARGLATSTAPVALGELAWCAARELSTLGEPRWRGAAAAFVAGIALPMGAFHAARRALSGAAARTMIVVLPSLALAACIAAWLRPSVLAAWLALGTLVAAAPVPPLPGASAATTRPSWTYVDAMTIGSVATMLARGMTVVPLGVIAWRAACERREELPARVASPRRLPAIAAMLFAFAAVTMCATLRHPDDGQRCAARVLLE